jgi:hypothetical protein
MKTVVFQPFQKVWTPRTPDSNYDSLGPPTALPIVNLKPPIQEGLGTGAILESGVYGPIVKQSSPTEGAGYGVTLVGASYSPPP